jgi:hypothetical protein
VSKKVSQSRSVQKVEQPLSRTVKAITITPDAVGELPEVLAAEPAVLTGALIGYARVSTWGQLLDHQLHALTAAGCMKGFTDKQSGRDADRPDLTACMAYLRAGNTLVVPSLDRSLQDLITLVGELRRHGVGFWSLHEALDTTHRAADSSSTSSPLWPSSSASSSLEAPTRPWPLRKPAA